MKCMHTTVALINIVWNAFCHIPVANIYLRALVEASQRNMSSQLTKIPATKNHTPVTENGLLYV